MIKINLHCHNAVEQAAFPLYMSIDLIVKSVSAVFPLVYAPISVKSDPPFGGGCLQEQTPHIPALVLGLWLRAWRGYNTWPCCCLAPAGWKPACHQRKRLLQLWKTLRNWLQQVTGLLEGWWWLASSLLFLLLSFYLLLSLGAAHLQGTNEVTHRQ